MNHGVVYKIPRRALFLYFQVQPIIVSINVEIENLFNFRFKSMFNDKRFVDKVDVDKRGRPKSFATKENFEKFYQLESSSENDEDDDEAKIEEKKDGKKESKKLKKKESKTIVSVKNKQTETKKGKKSKKLERETEKKQEQTETKKGKKSKKMERKTEKKEEQSEAESESDDDDKIISKLQKGWN